jgi:two-component system response regulator
MPVTSFVARFGASVRKHRFRLGISQEELGERADLHRTYIAGIERGGRNITLKNVEKLARALETSAGVLLSQADPNLPPAESNGRKLVDILLVEDNPDDANLALAAFRHAGVANPVTVAADGPEALNFIFGNNRSKGGRSAKTPGLILLDLNLPGMSGLDVLRRIKQDPAARRIPVIILTVSQRDRDIQECRRLGAATYIVKPLDFQSFSQVTPQFSLRWALLRPSQQYSEG